MYTNFGVELMATAKEYPVKIRKIPVLDKKTGITYFGSSGVLVGNRYPL